MSKLFKTLNYKANSMFKNEIKAGHEVKLSVEKFYMFCEEKNITKINNVTADHVQEFKTRNDVVNIDLKIIDKIFSDKRLEVATNRRNKSSEGNVPLGLQIHNKMISLTRYGISKSYEKHIIQSFAEKNNLYVNPLKNGGIYSHQTFENYKQTCIEFEKWLNANYPNVKDIEKISKDHAKEYLLSRQERGLSSWTTDKDLAAINKVFSFNMTKKEVGLKRKSYKDSVRSRKDSIMDTKYNPKNYENQILVAKSTGIRRQSMLKIMTSSFNKDISGKIISITVKEKGGKIRDALVLEKYRDELTNKINLIEKEKGNSCRLFDKYTSRIDNHAFRAEYARNLYDELLEKKELSKSDFYGKDKSLVCLVSQNLGHERPEIVVQHYFR